MLRIIISKAVKSKSVFTYVPKSFSKTFATYKSSTGLVGLAVDPDGVNTLNELSVKILESVQVTLFLFFFSFLYFLITSFKS